MATQYAFGKIVTNGLILALDAADRNSYVSGSATWIDVSGNGLNGTLNNGPTFSSARGGSINFNGTNQHVTFPGNTFNYSPGITGDLTLEMWITPNGPFTSYITEPPTTNLGGFIGQGYYNSSIGWGLGMLAISSSYYWQFQVRNSSTIVSTTGSFTTGSRYHVVGSFTRNDQSRLYVNGVLIASASSVALNGLSLTPSVADASIGRAGGGGAFYSGFNINKAAIYNRALSAAEVVQNFNAQKSRFLPLTAFARTGSIASENTVLSLTAPNGGTFTNVIFASYGNPSGTYPNYVTGSCHATSSVAQVAAAFISRQSGSIAASNAVFGDPCVGTNKPLYVILEYQYNI
jgi:hypothetical protein